VNATTPRPASGAPGALPGAMRRTWLFTPGNRPDRFDKAASSGADQIILDLEDSVEPSAKDEARRSVVEWLSHGGAAWVRINAKDSDYYEADVRMLAELPGLLGFMVPKAEVPAALEELGRRLPPRGLIPLIETAVGVHRAAEIGACEGVDRLAFGSIDFALDIEAAETSQSLLFARSQLVIASRVNGLPAPVDGVTTELRDTAAVAAAAEYARVLGFGGKLCIHPAQLASAAAAFAPTSDEVRWATEVLAVEQGDARVVDDRMVDRPVALRASRILAEHERWLTRSPRNSTDHVASSDV
jgi:citrate lyase subunit beta / citryl-CoA lyase